MVQDVEVERYRQRLRVENMYGLAARRVAVWQMPGHLLLNQYAPRFRIILSMGPA